MLLLIHVFFSLFVSAAYFPKILHQQSKRLKTVLTATYVGALVCINFTAHHKQSLHVHAVLPFYKAFNTQINNRDLAER